MVLASSILIAPLVASAALQTGVSSTVSKGSVSTASSAAPLMGRRAAVSAAGVFAAGLLSSAAANAYDALPSVEADFAEAEKRRKEKEARDVKKTAELVPLLKAIERSSTVDEFIPACDKLALWVIGEGSVPDGLGIKNIVARIKVAYDDLPKKGFKCEKTRDNNGICFGPGQEATGAYEALLRELRKYSMIQLGDYRKVEFRAF